LSTASHIISDGLAAPASRRAANTCLASNEELHESRHAKRANLDLAAFADTIPLTVDSRASRMIQSPAIFAASLDAAEADGSVVHVSKKLVIVFSQQ